MLFYFEKVDLRINGPFHNCEVIIAVAGATLI